MVGPFKKHLLLSLLPNLIVLGQAVTPARNDLTMAEIVERSRTTTLATRTIDGIVYVVSDSSEFVATRVGRGSRAFGIGRGKLATADDHGELIVTNLEKSSEVEVAEGFAVVRAAWASDGETLAAILQREGISYAILYGETRGTVWFPLRHPVLPNVLRWSADGRTLTYAERNVDGNITLVLWSEGEDRRVPVGQTIPPDLLDEPRADQGPATHATVKASPIANAAPANDEPAGAIPVNAWPFTNTMDTSQATTATLEYGSCYVPKGVWFKITPGSSGYLDIDTTGSNFYTRLGVYQGTSPANPSSRCASSYAGYGATKLTIAVTGGQTYWLLAGGDSSGANSNLTIRIAAGWNRAPTLPGVNTPYYSNVGGQFSVYANDVNGGADIRFTQLLVNSSLASAGGCYVHFDNAGGAVYLMNSSGTAWTGPLANNNSATLDNGVCTISGLYLSVDGEQAAATIQILFRDVKDGVQSVYARAVDSVGQDTQWQNKGTVTLDTLPPPPSLTRPANWGTGGTFSLRLDDPYGPSHVAWAQFMFTSDLTSNQACYVHYDRAGGALYLATDDGTGWTGPVTVGSGQTLANGQCTVQSSGQPTTGSSYLYLPLVIRFRDPAFRGVKQVLSRVVTITNRERPWRNTNETYEVTGVPRIASLFENDYNVPGRYSLNVSVSHPDGYAFVPWMQVIVTPDLSSVASCYIHIDRLGSQVWLMADNGYTWLPASSFGIGPALANSRCSVDVAQLSMTLQGNSVLVKVPVTFQQPNFLSNSTRLARTVDPQGRDSGWTANSYLPYY